MVQIAKRVALYCRVSTADQDGNRQEHDLKLYAKRAGWRIVDVFHETASGAKNDRKHGARVSDSAGTCLSIYSGGCQLRNVGNKRLLCGTAGGVV